MLLFLFAFVSGLVTILAPCIWPLLPIVLAASASGTSHKRPLGITLGIMVSFAVLTLCISFLVRLFHLDPNLLRVLAVLVLVFLGVSLLMPSFGAILEIVISRLSGTVGKPTQRNGFAGGFVTGLSLGVVWTPCAGPILATMATLAALGQLSLTLVGMMIAYVIGVGIPLFIVAYGGQKVISKTRSLSRFTGRIQQVFGVIILLTAVAIATNYDKVIQTSLLNAFPALSTNLTSFESNDLVKRQLDALKGNKPSLSQDLSGLFNADTPAPDLTGGTTWLNTQKSLTLADLKGKVVLVDFWTYTCINCLRTLPHVTSWYDTYKDQGFVVIGVHTPEFQFEHETNNVKQAIKMYNIHYPVVQDNNYTIWNNYTNEYWPAEYLIDSNGVIRRTHFGEGEYDQMDQAIRELLKEAGKHVASKAAAMPDTTPTTQLSPETYLGSTRMQYYYPDGQLQNGTQTFTFAPDLPTNAYGLGGEWTITNEDAVTGKNAILIYNFSADKVFLVLRPPNGGTGTIKVFLDDKQVTADSAGQDVHDGVVTVDQDRLYNLIDLKGKAGTHLLRLEFDTPGTQAFAFTFG